MVQQYLYYGDEFSTNDFTDKKDNPRKNKVYPTDITLFIERYLPEYREDIQSGKITEGMFRFPKLKAVHDVDPQILVPFNAVMSLSGEEKAANIFYHFFVHDYQFERMWSNPTVYMPFLLRIGRGIGPDFSAYLNMHPTEAIINCCRNRLLAFYLQLQGIVIIPNVCFGGGETLTWAFDGLPEDSVLALTTQGCMNDYVAKRALLNGMHELVRRKQPEMIYIYGSFPEEWKDKFGVEIRTLPTFSSKWRRNA